MRSNELGIEISNISFKYPVFRGNHSAFLAETYRQVLPQNPTSFIAFSIHNLSHMDLPWCIENQIDEILKNDKNVRPIPSLDEISDLMEDYSKVKEYDSIIIDISDKRDHLEKFLDLQKNYIRNDISPDSFFELMKKLEISMNDMKVPIDELEEKLKNKFIIFKTGFDKFWKISQNYSNPYFELRYSYLIHPYISAELINKLILEYHIEGIGSDTYGLENPLHFINKESIPPYANLLYTEFKLKNIKYRPVITRLMTERKVYIKNLKNITIEIDKAKGFIEGKLTVIPFALGNRDANVVRVFFRG